MIPRLGDGNKNSNKVNHEAVSDGLENDSPSRGRKRIFAQNLNVELV